MKWTIVVAVLLAAGTTGNLVVAITAARTRPQGALDFNTIEASPSDVAFWRSVAPSGFREPTTAWQWASWCASYHQLNGHAEPSASELEELLAHLEGGDYASTTIDVTDNSTPFRVWCVRYGWPMHCLRYDHEQQTSIGNVTVPSDVVWLPMMANSLFYAATLGALLGALVFIPGAVWKHMRTRLGRCTACGYLLQGLGGTRCPECGTALSRERGHLTRLHEAESVNPSDCDR